MGCGVRGVILDAIVILPSASSSPPHGLDEAVRLPPLSDRLLRRLRYSGIPTGIALCSDLPSGMRAHFDRISSSLVPNYFFGNGDAVYLVWDFERSVKKHIKQGQGLEGGIFSVEAPLHVSNVQVVDPVTGKPFKIGIRYLEDGTDVRVSRGQGSSGSIIPRPEILKTRTTPRPTVAGRKDTPLDLVIERTYDAQAGRGMPDRLDDLLVFVCRKPAHKLPGLRAR